jgi:phosphopantothenoylcysteine decarboxylase/phosphopantothenate--cysteine ligase
VGRKRTPPPFISPTIGRSPSLNIWRGKRVLITAGPTREPLDPVRFLSNASSGKTGFALAAAARRRGARVTLVSGPVALPAAAGVKVIRVTTAAEMRTACLRVLPGTDVVIGAAAVADFRPLRRARRKIKKGGGMTLKLIPTSDILSSLARRRRGNRLLMAGFALETERMAERALAKMAAKKLDLIVANGPEALDGDRTRAMIIGRDGRRIPYAGTKARLAERILDTLEGLP